MGCFYNIPPARTKDVPYLDVLTESINNPLRMLLGWYAVTSVLVPPVSLLVSYWPVTSTAAVKLTTGAFAALRENPAIGRAEAMRRSIRALIADRSSEGNADPSTWAPFVLVGEGG